MYKNELLERLKKSGSIKNVKTLAESSFFNEKDFIPTSVPILNIALSGKLDGGLSTGLTIIAGPSRHFKSLLGLMLVKTYLDKYEDSVCLFFDSEYGITPEYITANGIDTNRVLHIPVEHLEQLKFDIAKRLDDINRGDKVIVFIDSIGNLASKKEYEDALDEKSVADMTRSKTIKGIFRIITPHFTTKDIPGVIINHTYLEMALYPKTIMGGGCMVAGTQIKLADGSLINIEDVKENQLVMTLDGPKEVTYTWNPETLEEGTPECYEIEFEDGYKIVISDTHKFLIDNEWVEAKNLKVNDNVTTC